MKKRLIYFLCAFLLTISTSFSASAKSISKTETKNFLFTDSDLCPASANVTTELIQEYSLSNNGNLANYGRRYVCIKFSYAGNTTPRLTVYNPLYINSNGDTVASFSDWKPYEIMYPKGQHFPLHHYSTTIKQYSSRNAYSYNIKYFVGNSNFCDFGGAFKAGKLSLPLKVK